MLHFFTSPRIIRSERVSGYFKIVTEIIISKSWAVFVLKFDFYFSDLGIAYYCVDVIILFFLDVICSNMFERSFIWRWWKRSRNQSGGTNEGWINAKNVKTQKGIIKTNDDEKPNALFPPKTKLNQLNSTSTFDIDRYNITLKNQLKRFTIKLFKMYKFII